MPRYPLRAEVPEGCTVVEAADLAGIVLNTRCARQGTCGGCAVDLIEGLFQNGPDVFEVRPPAVRRVLGCQTRIRSPDWKVSVPRRSLVEAGEKIVADYALKRAWTVRPSVRRVYLEMPVPTIQDPIGDLERVERALRESRSFDAPIQPTLEVLRKLPRVLTEGGYKATFSLAMNHGGWDLVDVEPGDTSARNFGVAVDIGTTTVVCALVDLNSGRVIDRASCYNQQVQRADDVASRIVYAQRPGGLEELRQLVLDTVNRLTRLLCREHDLVVERVDRMTVSGNTIMVHLFLGVDPGNIGGIPFQPAATHPGTFRAGSYTHLTLPTIYSV